MRNRHTCGNRHPGESRDPGFKPVFKGWAKTWAPAFAGATLLILCACPAQADTTDGAVLLQRAQKFEQLGLMSLAREQYAFIKSSYPDLRGVDKALQTLQRTEAEIYAHRSSDARAWGALKVASLDMERAVRADPSNNKLKNADKQLKKELALRDALRARVSKDFLEGLRYFQENNTDRALESFVKVLNMDPNHRGALAYVERIGQRLEVDTRP